MPQTRSPSARICGSTPLSHAGMPRPSTGPTPRPIAAVSSPPWPSIRFRLVTTILSRLRAKRPAFSGLGSRFLNHAGQVIGRSLCEFGQVSRFEVIQGRDGPCRELAAESRDTERAIRLWHQKAALGDPPDLASFDFQRLQTDWGFRFLISTDELLEAAVFIIYGAQFANLLSLTEKPKLGIPVLRQLPARYRGLFREGCAEVLRRPEPARFSGAMRYGGDLELYRAAFMPLQGSGGSRPLIYGTFNRRAVPFSALRGVARSRQSTSDQVAAKRPRLIT